MLRGRTRVYSLSFPQRETLARILNITANNTLLELPTTTNATVSLLRVALSNMCTTKPLIERLDVAESSVASGCAVDVELSAMLILVKSLYEQSCEWVSSNSLMQYLAGLAILRSYFSR